MIVAAFGCNVAWRVAHAVFYLIHRFSEQGQGILRRILLILEPAGVLANHNPKTALVHLDSDQLALARLLAFVVVEATRGRTVYHGVDAKHHEPCPSST